METNGNYIASGGNRHPSSADWDVVSGLLAFGSDRNVAVWDPLVGSISNQHKLKTLTDQRIRVLIMRELRLCCQGILTKSTR